MNINLTDDLSTEVLAKLKIALEAKGLRFTQALTEPTHYNENAPAGLIHVFFCDTETTGADSKVDKLIELGGILAECDPKTGLIYKLKATINQLEDPGMPISAEATAVNGITDDMVAGKRINDDEVNALVSQAALVVCHNSGFDRTFLENRFSIFIDKPFACSFKQVNWVEEGVGSGKLEFILYKQGYHYEGHRAVNDCYALIQASQFNLPKTGALAMQAILTKARINEIDLAALGAPFDKKDLLKGRGYKWLDEDGVKYWHIPLTEDLVEAEVVWMRENIYSNRRFSLQHTLVNSKVRFSSRKGTIKVVEH